MTKRGRTLILVRHGESFLNEAERYLKSNIAEYDVCGVGLTKNGWKQSAKAGLWIKGNMGDRFDVIYMSDYPRSLQTVEAMCLKNGIQRTDERLRERDLHNFASMTHGEKLKKLGGTDQFLKQYMYEWTPDGGEDMSSVIKRAYSFLNDCLAVPNTSRILVVSHYYVIHALRLLLLNIPQASRSDFMVKERAIKNGQVFYYSGAHISDRSIHITREQPVSF